MKRRNTNNQGFVLITVLLTIVLLTVILLDFNYASRSNYRRSSSFVSTINASNQALSGINIAIAALKKNPDIRDNDILKDMAAGRFTTRIGNNECTVKLYDLSGKININTLKSSGSKLNRSKIDQLLRLIDLLNEKHEFENRLSYSIVPSIMDWTDTDEIVTILPFVTKENKGAESGYYKHRTYPHNGYKCKNSAIETPGELKYIKGILEEHLDPLEDCITLYGQERININTADLLVIQSLSESISDRAAAGILKARENKPFDSINQLNGFPGISPEAFTNIASLATTKPQSIYFKVESSISINPESNYIITAILKLDTSRNTVQTVYYHETTSKQVNNGQ